MTTTNKQKTQTEKAMPNGGPLERLFGSVTAKILDYMQIHSQTHDFSKQDIAKYSGVSPRHTTIALEKLEKLELITHTRNIGHAHMYKYNTESETAQLLKKFTTKTAFIEYKTTPTKEETPTKQKPTTTASTAENKQQINKEEEEEAITA
ncbi:MAG: helix-turn-helix domain-containing protein [Nitrososphaerota archaeon]|jgi:hypothetical protein|nr:helix-turn-helix domain-containing protein [Nitrososphaerota archaeon]